MPPSIPGPVSGVPARKIGLARRSIRGRVTVHGRSIAYESALERDNLLLLSLDPTVEDVVGQPPYHPLPTSRDGPEDALHPGLPGPARRRRAAVNAV